MEVVLWTPCGHFDAVIEEVPSCRGCVAAAVVLAGEAGRIVDVLAATPTGGHGAMKDLNEDGSGLLIAFLLPGLILLWGLSFTSPVPTQTPSRPNPASLAFARPKHSWAGSDVGDARTLSESKAA